MDLIAVITGFNPDLRYAIATARSLTIVPAGIGVYPVPIVAGLDADGGEAIRADGGRAIISA